MPLTSELRQLFNKALAIDSKAIEGMFEGDEQKADRSDKELLSVLDDISLHLAKVRPLTHDDKRQLARLIDYIRESGSTGVSGNEAMQLSRTPRRHIRVGIRLPAYMANNGIRLRKSPKGWNYIHEA